jgi:hypothetical protein
VPRTPITYEDVELLEVDGLGFTCRIGNDRIFIGKYVPLAATVHRAGDRGSLTLPRWFVEQQGLPLDKHFTDEELDSWLSRAQRRAVKADFNYAQHPTDAAQEELDRATDELAAAMLLRARRQGRPE